MSNLKHVDALIAIGKQQFQQIFAGRDVAFSDPVWEVGFLQVRLTGSELYKVRFTHWRTETEPLPAGYADVVKSWLLLNPSSPRHWSEEADALRIFYEVLEQRHTHFKWEALSEEDVRQLELWLRKRYARATTYARTNAVLKLARFLDSRAICRPLYYQVQTPCPSKAIFTEEAHARRRQRLPSKRALEGLADVYDHLAKFPPDRLRAAAVAVLAVTGFRISELLTVPVDCEVEEQHAGRRAYGIRYFKEKSKTPGKGFDVRWLTPLQAELARQAIAEIRQLTDTARVRAKELEIHDPDVPIPGVQPDDKLYGRDVMHLLGLCRVDAVHSTLTNQNVPRYGYEKKYYYFGKDIAAYLRNKRVKYLWTVNMGNGRYQMLSESLFVVFCDFFFPNRRTLPLLVEPVRGRQINGFLTSH
jgi:integrase